MTIYPKALYLGTKKKRQLATAKDEPHEQELRGKGYKDYADLPDDAPEPLTGSDGGSAECAKLKADWDDVDKVAKRLDELQTNNIVVPNHSDFERWTVKQLQYRLTKMGEYFPPRASKSELIQLINEAIDRAGADTFYG